MVTTLLFPFHTIGRFVGGRKGVFFVVGSRPWNEKEGGGVLLCGVGWRGEGRREGGKKRRERGGWVFGRIDFFVLFFLSISEEEISEKRDFLQNANKGGLERKLPHMCCFEKSVPFLLEKICKGTAVKKKKKRKGKAQQSLSNLTNNKKNKSDLKKKKQKKKKKKKKKQKKKNKQTKKKPKEQKKKYEKSIQKKIAPESHIHPKKPNQHKNLAPQII